MNQDDFRLVQDVLTEITRVMPAVESDLVKTLSDFREAERNPDALGVRDVRRLVSKADQLSASALQPVIDVFNRFARNDRRFNWAMDDSSWRKIRECSKLPDHARRSLEAQIIFNRALINCHSLAVPPSIRAFLQQAAEFLRSARKVAEECEVDGGYLHLEPRERLQPDLVSANSDEYYFADELNMLIESLERIDRYRNEDETWSDKKITSYLLGQLNELLLVYTERRITFGTSTSVDFDWITEVFKLLPRSDVGLQGAIKAFVHDNYPSVR